MSIDDLFNRVFQYGVEVGKLNEDYETTNESVDAQAEKADLFQILSDEVIGEDNMEIEWGLTGSALAEKLRNRNELRAKQRKKLKEILK